MRIPCYFCIEILDVKHLIKKVDKRKNFLYNKDTKKKGVTNMICANEVQKELILAKEREEERKRKEAIQAEQEKMIRVQNSISHCENVISKALLNMAKNRETCVVMHYEKNRYSLGVRHATLDSTRYANGKFSYSGYGDSLHLPTIKEYLEQHCFSVEVEPWTFMSYGFGLCHGYRLSIRIPKDLPCN